MKCYACAERNKTTDAMGVCAHCGMAVCRDHGIEHEIIISWADKRARRLLCLACTEETPMTWASRPASARA